MLAQEQNDMLTRVGPGTPMGNLLRRYWQPIAGVSELDDKSTKKVRLMGEDLVLYKDLSGNFGLVDRHCPHRRADLSYGFVEECGLRCNYHGWLFGADGSCLEQPYEDTVSTGTQHRDKVRATAYPVKAHAGLIWAYLGPAPAPELPDWEPFNWKNGFVQIVISEIPCNWLQGQENSIDPIHFEWMHANWSIRLRGNRGPYAARHLKIDFREFEHGYTYNRIREDTDENHPLWTVGRVCLWPNAIFTGDHFEYRVPVDDTNMLSVGWFFARVARDNEPFVQESIPTWYGPIAHPETGEWITSHVMNQDFVAWLGQGAISDRTKEHLGRSDVGVGMLRRQYFRDMQRIEQGLDPKGVLRDPARATNIELPIFDRKAVIEGLDTKAIRAGKEIHHSRFIFQFGQPPEVRAAQEKAMGIELEEKGYVDH
ncbi:MAG TPA: aromatic ring-hydroxylating dioxygenase subunit alpha [Sphingomonadaceae bacterium]|nr:aromatic ring-hydroxylating dioxygenase subunit alpha [Sphingomonadaceae bacterium]